MNYGKNSLLFLGLIITLCSLLSCSGSKNLAVDDSQENLSEIKKQLKFKTHFGVDGSISIKATNSSSEALDISRISVIIDKADNESFKAYSLEDFGVKSKISPLEVAIFDLSLEEIIDADFNGVTGKYNVILAYDSNKPLDNTENRSVYFVTCKYPIK